MMTKNITKFISIVCVVAVLMSVCVVALTSTSSAFKPSDTPIGSALKLDFEDNKGISDGTKFGESGSKNKYVTDPADPDNTVVQLYSNTKGGPNIEIGNADADTLDGSEAYCLAPDTEYVITFKYKYAKGSYGAGDRMCMQLSYGSQSEYSTAADKKKEVITNHYYDIDAIANPETVEIGTPSETVHVLANDTEWITFSYTFTTPADLVKNHLYIALTMPQTAPYAEKTVYIDDVTIDIIDELDDVNETLVYNFKEDSTGVCWDPTSANLMGNYDTGNSYVDAKGAHLYTTSAAQQSTSATWRTKVYVHDVDNGGFCQIRKDVTYMVTVKYKVESVEAGQESFIGISYQNYKNEPSANKSYTIASFPDAWASHTAVTETTQTLTTSFDGSDYEGYWLAVTANSKVYGKKATFLVESVTVRIMRNSNGLSIVDFETNGGKEIDSDIYVAGTAITDLPNAVHDDVLKGFDNWYLDKALTTPVGATLPAGKITLYAKWVSDFSTVTFNNSGEIYVEKLRKGKTLNRPERPNVQMIFEGWYTDLEFKNKVTVVPSDDCFLYAKYNYTYISFNNGGFTDTSHGHVNITTDPDEPTNKVLAINSLDSRTFKFELGNYDDPNCVVYELPKVNTTYYIKYDVKVPKGSVGNGTVSVYTGDQCAWSRDHTQRSITSLRYSWEMEASERGIDWVTVSCYYKVGENFYGNDRINFCVMDQLYFGYIVTGLDAADCDGTVYIDNVMVGEYIEEVPEGITAYRFETNSDDIAPVLGHPEDALIMPEDPELIGHVFLGWYTDMNFKNKFEFKSGMTFGSKDVTLYAKWKAVTILFDYETHSTRSGSARFNLEKDANGNQYLRYNFEQGNSTTSSTFVSRSVLNNNELSYCIGRGGNYIVKFKYNLVETEGNTVINILTHDFWSVWTNSKTQVGNLALSTPTNGWVEGEIKFTANLATPKSGYVSLGVSGDSTILIDDVQIICDRTFANVYGDSVVYFNSVTGPAVDPVSGNVGDKIVLPTPKRSGYKFGGWYTDKVFMHKFTETTYGEDDVILYAYWILGKLSESYEDFPISMQIQGISTAYDLYNKDVENFDKANVQQGANSIYRDGTVSGTKAFTLCRDTGATLGVGEQYTLSFYVKPTNVTDATGTINLVTMSTNTSISTYDTSMVVTDLGSLKVGEWQRVEYTFTADQSFIGIATTAGNDMYFDNFVVTLKGYTGGSTGDSTVSPVIICMMAIFAAGALVVTGKKVFE